MSCIRVYHFRFDTKCMLCICNIVSCVVSSLIQILVSDFCICMILVSVLIQLNYLIINILKFILYQIWKIHF